MVTLNEKKVLVSGASMAGLSTAWWMNRLGYKVTVVEIANQPRTAGAAVDIKGACLRCCQAYGYFEEIQSNRLHLEMIEFKNADDITESSVLLTPNSGIELST